MATSQGWAKAVTRVAEEFGPAQLPIISGQLPTGLEGTLYRNGPGRLERGGASVGHWFDGDGAILRVHFDGERATGTYRYVQTQGYQAETQAGRLLYGGYGMVAPGPWERLSGRVKNAANTSVLAVDDRLLALWEGGYPHALDPVTLQTEGETDLGMTGKTYSAHPKRDPVSGYIYNFGVSYGAKANLHLYQSDATGRVVQESTIPLPGLPLVHDFVLAGNYLIFCVSPIQLDFVPIVLRLKGFGEAFDWQPERGTTLLVIDRNNLQLVSQGETAPWFQWHFSNGYQEVNGMAVLGVARYPDFQTNQFLREVASGVVQTPAQATLWQVTLDPKTAQVLESVELSSRPCEFPTVDPSMVGQENPHTYLALHRLGLTAPRELLGSFGRFDHRTGELTEAPSVEGSYPSEPIFATGGWVLTVVYDSQRDLSTVDIHEAERLEAGPVCQLALPGVVPPGFHGTWRRA
ncbi:carotenoid oxygenase family protein [Candidatus Cyanaurora vandensis]|uniref:carotenoid oxygenase family protein n=1 Tax=Candidatus Cyanaurora vandensis TaxID=2714958 RepID=UPI00257D7D2A|nr:carotenoid oxygenase family protein [Candidatus Cyanaurora vandensis]